MWDFSRHVIFISPTFSILIKINTSSLSIPAIILHHKGYHLKSSRPVNFHLELNHPKNFHLKLNYSKNLYLDSNHLRISTSNQTISKISTWNQTIQRIFTPNSHPKNFHAPCINAKQCPCIITTHLTSILANICA